jgi:hypothetical protein
MSNSSTGGSDQDHAEEEEMRDELIDDLSNDW